MILSLIVGMIIPFGQQQMNKLKEFREIFHKGCTIDTQDDRLIMMCKNIDFGHVDWPFYITSFFGNKELMYHIVDNIVDINAQSYPHSHTTPGATLLNKIMFRIIAGGCNNNCDCGCIIIIAYIINNGYIDNDTLKPPLWATKLHSDTHLDVTIRLNERMVTIGQLSDFVNHLTTTSLKKFTRFYNVEKYYYIAKLLLLITKVQSKFSLKWLPPNILKHIILPLVYQSKDKN